jgi:hypothetical protein
MVIFTAGSALCAAAQDPLMLIVSRAVQGVGGPILGRAVTTGTSWRGPSPGPAKPVHPAPGDLPGRLEFCPAGSHPGSFGRIKILS